MGVTWFVNFVQLPAYAHFENELSTYASCRYSQVSKSDKDKTNG